MKTRWMRWTVVLLLLAAPGCQSGPSSWAFWRRNKSPEQENKELADASLTPELTKTDLPSAKAKPGGPSFNAVTKGAQPPAYSDGSEGFDPAAYPGQDASSAPDFNAPYGAPSVGETAFAPPATGGTTAQQGAYSTDYPGGPAYDAAQNAAAGLTDTANAYAGAAGSGYEQAAQDVAQGYADTVSQAEEQYSQTAAAGYQAYDQAQAATQQTASNLDQSAAELANSASGVVNAAGAMMQNPYAADPYAASAGGNTGYEAAAAAYTADARNAYGAAPPTATGGAADPNMGGYPDTGSPDPYADAQAGGSEPTYQGADPYNGANYTQQLNAAPAGTGYSMPNNPASQIGQIHNPPGGKVPPVGTPLPPHKSSVDQAPRRTSTPYRPGSTASAFPTAAGWGSPPSQMANGGNYPGTVVR